MLKKDRKKDKKEDITIEELVEIERSNLGYNLTKITLESFLEWKKKKIAEKRASSKKESDRRKAEFKAGKNVGLSGREMFTFNPELAADNDMEEGEAAMDIVRESEEDETGDAVKEIDLDQIANEAKEVDHSAGTQAAEKRDFATKAGSSKDPDKPSTSGAGSSTSAAATTNGEGAGEGGDDEEEEEGEDDIINEPIDETLFAEDDDLDGLEDELNAATL